MESTVLILSFLSISVPSSFAAHFLSSSICKRWQIEMYFLQFYAVLLLCWNTEICTNIILILLILKLCLLYRFEVHQKFMLSYLLTSSGFNNLILFENHWYKANIKVRLLMFCFFPKKITLRKHKDHSIKCYHRKTHLQMQLKIEFGVQSRKAHRYRPEGIKFHGTHYWSDSNHNVQRRKYWLRSNLPKYMLG